MTDEKYDKARRQSLNKRILLAIILVAALSLAVVWVNVTQAAKQARGKLLVAQPIPVLKLPPAIPELTVSLIKEVGDLDAEVRKIKETGVQDVSCRNKAVA